MRDATREHLSVLQNHRGASAPFYIQLRGKSGKGGKNGKNVRKRGRWRVIEHLTGIHGVCTQYEDEFILDIVQLLFPI